MNFDVIKYPKSKSAFWVFLTKNAQYIQNIEELYESWSSVIIYFNTVEDGALNQGNPEDDNNLTCALPKWHDIINLKNKWGVMKKRTIALTLFTIFLLGAVGCTESSPKSETGDGASSTQISISTEPADPEESRPLTPEEILNLPPIVTSHTDRELYDDFDDFIQSEGAISLVCGEVTESHIYYTWNGETATVDGMTVSTVGITAVDSAYNATRLSVGDTIPVWQGFYVRQFRSG